MPFLIITIQVELTPNGYDSLDVAVIASFKMPSTDEEGNVVTLDGFVGNSRGMLKNIKAVYECRSSHGLCLSADTIHKLLSTQWIGSCFFEFPHN
jgi:hypothetical protein